MRLALRRKFDHKEHDVKEHNALSDSQARGRHRQIFPSTPARRRPRFAVTIATMAVVVGIGLSFVALSIWRLHDPPPQRQGTTILPTAPGSYIGLYRDGVPASYAEVASFTAVTGVTPSVVVYYSGWMEPFQASFAETVIQHHAVPLVQIDPTKVSLRLIATGRYDNYLNAYADSVKAFRRPVILSFGHEMNGDWYSWGYRHTSSAVFVSAWRHIVRLFRSRGADNVTWLWAVNVIHAQHGVASPGPWWPGASYVTWVGIDGYYHNSSTLFAPLFGPTVAAVRVLTRDPILIAETAVAPAAGQPAKIANLFAGIRLYGLLGFVWFDVAHTEDWRLTGSAAVAAFRLGAESYHEPGL